MLHVRLLLLTLALLLSSLILSAQNYKTDRIRKAVQVLDLHVEGDSLMPEETVLLKIKDGRKICLRTNSMGEVEHIGIPLFNDVMRILQPSPVYDFLEYAVLNWKYKVSPNRLYLSSLIFKKGGWDTLLKERLSECDCMIENREDKLYIVTWKQSDKEIAVIGIPIQYELLNNDTRRNMERDFIKGLDGYNPMIIKKPRTIINESKLSIYGTEGLFVLPGESYIMDYLNQNIYYRLSTINEKVDTVINQEPVLMEVGAILPVVVNDQEFPNESFANLMMCDDASVPEITMELEFHLSDYRRQHITTSLSSLKAFCRQHGCRMFFAGNGAKSGKARGVMFASNIPKGYNHLFSISIPVEQITSPNPTVKSDVYLYIPPIEKNKLFGTVPTKKSGANFKLP